MMPWYTESNFRFQPWRPLAELTHAFDSWLWPTHPVLMHAHQLVWVLAFFLAVWRLYRHFFTENSALIALALIGLIFDGNMAQTHVWLAGRNTLISATFSVLCLLFYSRSQRENSSKWYLLSILLFAIALFSSELALGTTAFLFSYVYFMQKGTFKKFLNLIPFLLTSLIWIGAYKFGHQGVSGSDWYFDPATEPREFVSTLLYRFPKALFQQFFILPLEIFGKVHVGTLAWFIGLTTLLALGFAFKNQFKSNTVKFLVAGSFLSIIPLCAGPGIPRVLLLLSVGIAPLVASFMLSYLKGNELNKGQRILVWIVLPIHVLGALAPALTGYVLSSSDVINIQTPARTLPVTSADNGKQWVILNSTDPMQAMLYPLVRGGEFLSLPKNWYLSGAGLGEIDINKVSDHALEITSKTAFLASPADYFVRKRATQFELNQANRFDGMSVTALALTEDNRPEKVRFEFDRSLDEENTVLFICQKYKLTRISLKELGNNNRFNCSD